MGGMGGGGGGGGGWGLEARCETAVSQATPCACICKVLTYIAQYDPQWSS